MSVTLQSHSWVSLTHFLLCVRPQWSGVCRPILRECRRAPNCNRAGVLLGNGSHQAIVILSPISPYSYQNLTNLTHTFFFPHTHTEKAKYHCNLPFSPLAVISAPHPQVIWSDCQEKDLDLFDNNSAMIDRKLDFWMLQCLNIKKQIDLFLSQILKG